MTRRLARFLALAAAPLTLTAVACSSSGGSTPSGAPAPTSAAPVTITPPAATPAACAVTENDTAKPPSNVPTPTDAVFYEKVAQGSTTQYFAYAPGNDVKHRRDAIKTQLSGAGYEIKGTDAEDNEEAELEFEGKGHNDATVQVIRRTGCPTMLRIRFTLHG